MLDIFASVGATRFDVTWTNARRRQGTVSARRDPCPISSAPCPRCSTHAARQAAQRDRAPAWRSGVTFIQLDDLNADQLARLAPAVFLALETSPGNFQAWVAMPASEDKDFARRLRKGTGADPTASGATASPGASISRTNTRRIFRASRSARRNPGRVTNAAELERLGLVAAPETVEPARLAPARSRPSGSNRKWPSYARCLDGAPLNSEETGPDISRARFCVVHDGDHLGMDGAGDRRAADGGKRQGAGERTRLCRAHRPQRRPGRGTPPAAAKAAAPYRIAISARLRLG